MRQEEKDLLLSYLIGTDFQIENEITEFRNRLRFRHIDVNDLVEGLLLYQRQADFQEFALTVIRLLHLETGS